MALLIDGQPWILTKEQYEQYKNLPDSSFWGYDQEDFWEDETHDARNFRINYRMARDPDGCGVDPFRYSRQFQAAALQHFRHDFGQDLARADAAITMATLGAVGVKAGLSFAVRETTEAAVGRICLSRQATKGVDDTVRNAGDDIRNWLGDFNIRRSDDAGFVAVSEDRKRRFRVDFDGHGDKPHAHLEVFDGRRWRDAIDRHRFHFCDE